MWTQDVVNSGWWSTGGSVRVDNLPHTFGMCIFGCHEAAVDTPVVDFLLRMMFLEVTTKVHDFRGASELSLGASRTSVDTWTNRAEDFDFDGYRDKDNDVRILDKDVGLIAHSAGVGARMVLVTLFSDLRSG